MLGWGRKVALVVLLVRATLASAAEVANFSAEPANAPPGTTAEVTVVITDSPEEAKEVLKEAVLSAKASDPGVPIAIDSAQTCSAKQPSDWRCGLSISRFVFSGAVMGYAVQQMGGTATAILVNAALAAGWAGWWQLKNQWRLDWLGTKSWWRASGEPAGIFRRYSKRAVFTTTYGGLLTLGFHFTGLTPDLWTIATAAHLGTMVGESLAMQTPLEAVNKILRDRAIQRDPKRAYLYQRLSGIGSFLQAMIAVGSNALNLGGIKLGSILSLSAAAAGYLTWGLLNRKAIAATVVKRLEIMGRCPEAFRYMGGY